MWRSMVVSVVVACIVILIIAANKTPNDTAPKRDDNKPDDMPTHNDNRSDDIGLGMLVSSPTGSVVVTLPQ